MTHGGVDLETDVDVIVIDPSFRHTAVHRVLEGAGRRFDVRSVGVAARDIVWTESLPSGDPPETEAQQLEYLWHTVLAIRFVTIALVLVVVAALPTALIVALAFLAHVPVVGIGFDWCAQAFGMHSSVPRGSDCRSWPFHGALVEPGSHRRLQRLQLHHLEQLLTALCPH